MTEPELETVTCKVSQIIPPDEQINYALNDRTRALAGGNHLATLDARDGPNGIRERLSMILDWIRDPRDTGDDVYNVVFEGEPPKEGEEIAITLERIAPDLWAARGYSVMDVRTDGGEETGRNRLLEIQESHEHRVGRMVVQDVSGDREVLTCHECQSPIAENRHDGNGWGLL